MKQIGKKCLYPLGGTLKQIGKKCLYPLGGTHYKTLNVGTYLNEDKNFLQLSLARETTGSLQLQKLHRNSRLDQEMGFLIKKVL